MLSETRRALRPLLLLAASTPAFAQYVSTPPPGAAPPPGSSEVTITPKNGQNQQQQWTDRYACHDWAVSQSGFDPTRKGSDSSADAGSHREQYRRALSACLEGRGYSVSEVARPAAAAPAAAPSEPPPARHPVSVESQSKHRALSLQLDAGYVVTTGNADQYLHNGGTVGLGFTWFPISALPVGVRVDGSYSWFDIRNTAGNWNYGFSPGHENVYGGDVDLQLDLAHTSERAKMYLVGGAGWYREQLHTRQVSIESGTVCDFYYCFPGEFPVVTSVERSTSPWHSSWNAGLGWQMSSYDGGPSLFIEARYVRIAPRNTKTEFIPIRVGVRF
jgi:hypothetical protein